MRRGTDPRATAYIDKLTQRYTRLLAALRAAVAGRTSLKTIPDALLPESFDDVAKPEGG